MESQVLTNFNAIKADLNSWGKEVDETLMNILNDSFVSQYKVKIAPKFRMKDDKSYLSKALWRKKSYTNPILDIEDKIGTRIVMLTTKDVIDSSKVLSSYNGWTIKLTKDMNQIIEENPELFSYQSIHFVVSPLDSRKGDFTTAVENLTCEIQIRTLLQHSYAEVSHDSTYKGPYKNDSGIIRHLSKSMALMEATDDYFCNIFDLMNDESRFYNNYTNELIRLYNDLLASNFQKNDVDIELFDCIYSILEKKQIGIDQIEEFIEKHKTEITSAMLAKNGLLFIQPIFLLVAYYFFEHRTFLVDEWTLNNEHLRSVFKVFNTSYTF